MQLFKRKTAVLDLAAAEHMSVCPSCGAPGSTDYVDLVLQKALHTCGRCARLWETTGHVRR
jgi:hypothetical protein